MTKFEIRVLTLALLDCASGERLLDIGAGTGSVSVQAARLGAEVWAIERKPEGLELIAKNAEQFGVSVNLIAGSAPEAIATLPECTRCFIGGSGGKLPEIFERLESCLAASCRVAANFITVENLVESKRLFEHYGYRDIETRLIQSAQLDKYGLLRGHNPVFIIKGDKG